jgi:hypothetical protein
VNGSLWTLPKEFSLYMILLAVGAVGAVGGLGTRSIANIACAIAVILHLRRSGTYHLSAGDINVDSVLFCFFVGVLFFVNRDHIVVSLRIALVAVVAAALSVRYGFYSFVMRLRDKLRGRRAVPVAIVQG